MKNSKLLETLDTFTPEELDRLDLYLHSPYFQKDGISKDELLLFTYLKGLYPDFDSEKVNKLEIFKKLYPNSDVVKGKLEKKMSALLQHIQNFIIQQGWEVREEPVRKLLLLSRFYQERESPRLYKLIIRRIQKALENRIRKDKRHYFDEFLVQSEITEYESLNTTRKNDMNLPTTLRSLDIFYLTDKLEYSCGFLAASTSHSQPKETLDLEELFKPATTLASSPYLDIPLIKAYAKAFSFLQNRADTASYHDLLSLLQNHRQEFAKADLKVLRAICRNFSIYQFNQGHKEYLRGAFQLYKEDLEDGLLYHKNGLIPSTIRNLVTIGLIQEQYDWVYQLLEDHKDRIIGAKHPKDVYHFNLATYFFAQKDYEHALDYLADYYEDLYYQIAARRLEIKVHYELDSPLLDAKMDAFKVFIYRLSKAKLTEQPRRGNKSFFNALRQIINPATAVDGQRLERLIEKIKKKKVIAEKGWLLEKMEELRNK